MLLIDFEYRIKNNNWKTVSLVSVCCKKVGEDPRFFRLSTEFEQRVFKEWYGSEPQDILCYAANAEVCSLLTLNLKVGKVIDLWNECKMFCLTHPDWFSSQHNLAEMMRLLAKNYGREDFLRFAEKDVRDIIIDNQTYTEDQWKLIEAYNIRDVEALRLLYNHFIKPMSELYGITSEDMFQRGEFAKACAVALFRGKGIPIDETFLETVYGNKDFILSSLYQRVNSESGETIFSQNKDGSWSRKQLGFENLLIKKGLYDVWQKTATGKSSTKGDVFEEFLSKNKNVPIIDLLHETISTAKAFSSTDYRSLLDAENYIQVPSFPFNQKTSRSSPKPALGFALNLQPWMRRMIKPKEGMVFIGADWGKQEIAIAAALSGDEFLKKDYQGDIYIENAKLCGIVPQDATKKSHPDPRQKFKAIVLGMGYGKQEESVAKDLMVIFNLEEDEARLVARTLFEQRQERYEVYYRWVDETNRQAMQDGFYKTLDNWFYFTDKYTRTTQLQNLPMQSNGAAIMRRGFIRAVQSGLDVVCSLHDALYINAKENEAKEASQQLMECMRLAVSDILGDRITIENEVKIIYSHERFKDGQGRDEATLRSLAKIIPKFEEYL